MSTTHASDRFTALPDDQTLAATVVALEEHGFSVEVVDGLDAGRDAVLARIPEGSSVMTNTSVTLQETGIADATRRTTMTRDATPETRRQTLEPLDQEVDHVRGPTVGRVILEYGDYECPYSRRAFREIERVERQLSTGIRFAFRHFPLTEIHPHAFAAAAAAEAAALQDRFWAMHELLFDRQHALTDDDLQRYAAQLRLDVARFDHDRAGAAVRERIRRDVESGIASGAVRGTPTLFIDGVVHLGGYGAATLMEALAG